MSENLSAVSVEEKVANIEQGRTDLFLFFILYIYLNYILELVFLLYCAVYVYPILCATFTY